MVALNGSSSRVSKCEDNESKCQPQHSTLKPFNCREIKVLLLEGVSHCAVDAFEKIGCQVESVSGTLSEEALIHKIRHVHVIGIRSKTKLSRRVLEHAEQLLAIGCFCIATEQVDLEAAASKGIAVFNSPFSNSRSVAELVIGEIITLARQLGERNQEMHRGIWNKVSSHCYEIRGKVLGIVGYGHVGSQLSVMAEALGMVVYFYDIQQLMPLGTCKQVGSLHELLRISDFVSLHVPEDETTRNMIGDYEIMACMKPGAYLLNNARASILDIQALVRGLQSGHLAGAAIDVFPSQPTSNGPYFTGFSDLAACPNVILTPHIGGSTEEAQKKIGLEVSSLLINYMLQGTSAGAVNIPEVDLRVTREEADAVRVLHIHKNIPGVLRAINEIFVNVNVKKQFSDSRRDIAYVITDIAHVSDEQLRRINNAIVDTHTNIKTRILY